MSRRRWFAIILLAVLVVAAYFYQTSTSSTIIVDHFKASWQSQAATTANSLVVAEEVIVNDAIVRPPADVPKSDPSAKAREALSGPGTGFVPFPNSWISGKQRPQVGVITVASGRYRTFGLELLQSAIEYFCHECDLHLFLLTSKVSDLPANLDSRIKTQLIPFREWPKSTLNKCNDIVRLLGDEISTLDFVLFLDADTRFVANITLEDVYGLYVGVEHPYYPRNAKGFCGRYGQWASTNAHGFDSTGSWTYCQYPYDRNQRSAAYIDISLGKLPPGWDSGNSYYFQGALFGGTGPRFLHICDSIDKSTLYDTANGVLASFHDESQLNAFLLRHMDQTRVLSPGFIYPEPPLDTTYNFEWLFNAKITPRVVHRVKDADALRKELP